MPVDLEFIGFAVLMVGSVVLPFIVFLVASLTGRI